MPTWSCSSPSKAVAEAERLGAGSTSTAACADQGLHPVLGESGDPGPPAAALLRCLGIEPAAEGNQRNSQEIQDQLAQLRNIFFGDR